MTDDSTAMPTARATHEPSPDGLGHPVGVSIAERCEAATGAERAKPLFWYKSTDHPQDNGKWTAHGIGGRYSIENERDGGFLLWWAHDEFIWEACASMAEAKEKAEADWQRRFTERMLP